jgi:PAS domain S-box-containing protein
VVTAKNLATIAKEKESVRRKLEITAKDLARAKARRESVRNKLAVTAKQLAVTAKEKESIRSKLAVTAKQLAVTAKEKESIRRKLVVTAEKKESVRRKLVVTAKEKESIRSKLMVTAEKLRLKAKQLAVTAKEKEDVRNKLVVTAKNLATIAKEKESVRRKLEITAKDLARAKAKDEALLASIGDGVIATDNEGIVIMINRAAEILLDQKSRGLIGKKLNILHIYDDKDTLMPFKERPIYTALSTGQPTTAIFFYERRDGTKFPAAITATPVILNKNIVGAIEVFRDITREKELDRMKSEFISIASHQLRTPLTSIQWVVERFTKKEKLTLKGREYLDDIHTSTKRLTNMVNLLLSLSRIEAGRIVITPEPLEIIGFIKSFLEETVPLQDKKEIRIVFEDHPAELAVKTDKSALHNVVQSLISNAIEYTPNGGKIAVTVQKEEDKFMIKVQDTGIGIPKAEQAHIFEKFVRASNAKLYKTDGTGIGLYIAERATNLLGGKIWFESEENKGSTFYVELPLQSGAKAGEQPVV